MWVSKSKWEVLEKRVADLEKIVDQIQMQLKFDPQQAEANLAEIIHQRSATHDSVPRDKPIFDLQDFSQHVSEGVRRALKCQAPQED